MKDFLVGTLVVALCRLSGQHRKMMVTSEDRLDLYIGCPVCKRRTHGWQLEPDRRIHHRTGTPYVQRIVTKLPLAEIKTIHGQLADRRRIFRGRRDYDTEG